MKKGTIAAGSVLLALAVTGGIIYSGSHVFVGGSAYAKNQSVVDLRDKNLGIAEYLLLREKLPNAQIQWELPFQGKRLPLDTEIVAVSTLTEDDIAALELLPMLREVDGLEAADNTALIALQAQRPDLLVRYTVRSGENRWASTDAGIVAENADAKDLMEKLSQLPKLKTVWFSGEFPSPADAEKLQERYPEVDFLWEVHYADQIWDKDTTGIDVSGQSMDAEALEEILTRLPKLEWVGAQDCGIGQEEMKALVRRWPNIEFLWDMEVFGKLISTDAEEIDLSGIKMDSVEQAEELIAFFPKLKKVSMHRCGIDDETMDALNRRHEDVRYVWSVKIDWKWLPTDTTWFMPWKLDIIVDNDSLYPLRYCTDITWIDLGHKEVSTIEWAAFMPNLKYLLLGDTKVSDISPLAGLKNLIYLEIFKTKVTDYSPLLSCTALEDLNLSYTFGDPEPIAQMTWLKNVWWHRCCPPWGGPEYETRLNLAQYLPNAYVDVNYTEGSTDGGWRELPNYIAMRDYLKLSHMTG